MMVLIKMEIITMEKKINTEDKIQKALNINDNIQKERLEEYIKKQKNFEIIRKIRNRRRNKGYFNR